MRLFKIAAKRQVRFLIYALVGAMLFVAASHWVASVDHCEVLSRSGHFCLVPS